MHVSTSQPFLTSHDVSDIHFPIIDNIGKMIGRPLITSHDDKIFLWSALQLSIDLVFYGVGPLLNIALYSYGIWLVIF